MSNHKSDDAEAQHLQETQARWLPVSVLGNVMDTSASRRSSCSLTSLPLSCNSSERVSAEHVSRSSGLQVLPKVGILRNATVAKHSQRKRLAGNCMLECVRRQSATKPSSGLTGCQTSECQTVRVAAKHWQRMLPKSTSNSSERKELLSR